MKTAIAMLAVCAAVGASTVDPLYTLPPEDFLSAIEPENVFTDISMDMEFLRKLIVRVDDVGAFAFEELIGDRLIFKRIEEVE